jgi:hypothetical protein
MASLFVLEHYFQCLPSGDGLGSSSFASAGSSIASSINDVDTQMRPLHNICPLAKRRKLQPQGVTLPRSNPAVKLLIPTLLVQDTGGTARDGGGVATVASTGDAHTDLSTGDDMVVLENLESSEEDMVNDDDDF